MRDVVRIVNYLRHYGLNRRKFKEFQVSLDAEYCDVPYYTEVRWLRRGKVLKRFFHLREEIALFLDMQGKPDPKLSDKKWIADLAFLTHVTEHLHDLNVSLQGRDHLITDLSDKIMAFKANLELWKAQLKMEDTYHFTNLGSICLGVNFDEYVLVIEALIEEFSNRFQEFLQLKPMFDSFVKPFSIPVIEVAHEFQMEIINLQSSTRLKDIVIVVTLY